MVSRQPLIDSAFSSVICAPVYSPHDGLNTQVPVGPADGLKPVGSADGRINDSSIHCDDLASLPKSMLTNYVGHLKPPALRLLNSALAIALGLDAALDPFLSFPE